MNTGKQEAKIKEMLDEARAEADSDIETEKEAERMINRSFAH